MGTSLELRVAADDAEAARSAEDRVLREIDRLSRIFSGYDAASEFRRWQAGGQEAEQGVSRALRAALGLRRLATRGAAGPSIPGSRLCRALWTRAARQGRTPTTEEMTAARSLMSSPAWRLDPGAGTAVRLSDCPLSLNGIAKGYIVERPARPPLDRGRGFAGSCSTSAATSASAGEIAADDRHLPPPGPIRNRPSRWPSSRSRTARSPPAGAPSAGSRSTGSGTRTSSIPRSGLPVERVARARRSSRRDRSMPTPSRRSATSSTPEESLPTGRVAAPRSNA